MQGDGFRPVRLAARPRARAGRLGAQRRAPASSPTCRAGADAVEAFCRRVRLEAPAGARIERVGWAPLDPRPVAGFTVAASSDAPDGAAIARPPWPKPGRCRRLPGRPRDLRRLPRRARRPRPTAGTGTRSSSCAACGPRFTVVTGLPFDRSAHDHGRASTAATPAAATTRTRPAARFRSATMACHACGPALELLEASPGRPPASTRSTPPARPRAPRGRPRPRPRDPRRRRDRRGQGRRRVPPRVRRHQRRGRRPAARAQAAAATGRSPCSCPIWPRPARSRTSATLEAGLLTAGRRPVVLAAPRPGGRRSRWRPRWRRATAGSGCCCRRPPLHVLLLGLPGDEPGPRALVLTSGNLAGEPIVTDDEEALRRLSGRGGRVAAARPADPRRRATTPWSRSSTASRRRCAAPAARRRCRSRCPLDVEPTVAAGGDLKNAFCVAEGRSAWLSAHVGDMDDIATQRAFARRGRPPAGARRRRPAPARRRQAPAVPQRAGAPRTPPASAA